MKRTVFLIGLLVLFSSFSFAQKKAKPKPHSTPAKSAAKPSIDMGSVSGRTYTNKTFGFEITFPDTWLIPDSDFEKYMKKQGLDVSLKIPESLPVKVLLTAYRSMPGTMDNAIARISVEDLKANPQIKNEIDYFDAMRRTFKTLKMPSDFKYSATQSEKLGYNQFGFLDVSSDAGKRRMYAIVRNGFAIMFTLSYSPADDLDVFRQVLRDGSFDLK